MTRSSEDVSETDVSSEDESTSPGRHPTPVRRRVMPTLSDLQMIKIPDESSSKSNFLPAYNSSNRGDRAGEDADDSNCKSVLVPNTEESSCNMNRSSEGNF